MRTFDAIVVLRKMHKDFQRIESLEEPYLKELLKSARLIVEDLESMKSHDFSYATRPPIKIKIKQISADQK